MTIQGPRIILVDIQKFQMISRHTVTLAIWNYKFGNVDTVLCPVLSQTLMNSFFFGKIICNPVFHKQRAFRSYIFIFKEGSIETHF